MQRMQRDVMQRALYTYIIVVYALVCTQTNIRKAHYYGISSAILSSTWPRVAWACCHDVPRENNIYT